MSSGKKSGSSSSSGKPRPPKLSLPGEDPKLQYSMTARITIKGENVVGTINASGSARVNVNQKVVHQATPELDKLFKRIRKEIQLRPADATVDQNKVQNQVKKIEVEAARGSAADKGKLERWIRALAKMAPHIVEVMAASLGGPVAGFTLVFKKIVERARTNHGEIVPNVGTEERKAEESVVAQSKAGERKSEGSAEKDPMPRTGEALPPDK